MKRSLICILFLLCCATAFGQVNLRRSYALNRGNVAKLAQQINSTAVSDSQRVANIHFWITHHIKYDAKRSAKWQTQNQETKDVLKRRKTLCSGYANLFQDLCLASGINAVVVNGYAKNELVDICDSTYLPNHAWNKVEIDGYWYNIDNSWDAGVVSYYKTSSLRRFEAHLTHGLIRPYAYKPHFIKQCTNQYYLSNDNSFAVTHYPENSTLTSFKPQFDATKFSQDSAFYFNLNTLQSRPKVAATSFNTYATYDAIEQDQQDGKHAYEVNDKNFFGSARYHYHNLFEEWEKYVEDPKTMKLDSVYLKSVILLSDSVLVATHNNDSLIWEEYRDLTAKYRQKSKIQRGYSSDYTRYLKRKLRYRNHQLQKIHSKKNRSNKRRKLSNKRYDRMMWRHFYHPGKWSEHPNQEKADSLTIVFKSYEDSIKQTNKEVAALQEQLRNQFDSLNSHVNDQVNYIHDVTSHFDFLIQMRLAALDDFDLRIQQEKANFNHYTTSDSSIRLSEQYDLVYDLMDSIYRLGKKNYRYISRQRSVLKRVKRSTGSKMQYYALYDDFRKNVARSKSAEAAIQNDTKLVMKQMKRLTKSSAPVGLGLTNCQTEKQIALPLTIIKSKRHKNSNDNKKLKRFAKKTQTKASSKLDVLRLESR